MILMNKTVKKGAVKKQPLRKGLFSRSLFVWIKVLFWFTGSKSKVMIEEIYFGKAGTGCLTGYLKIYVHN